MFLELFGYEFDCILEVLGKFCGYFFRLLVINFEFIDDFEVVFFKWGVLMLKYNLR